MKHFTVVKQNILKIDAPNLITRKTPFLCLFLLIRILSFAQSNQITATLLDADTKLPISFATILIEKTNLGLYANEEGDFTLKNYKSYKSSTLIISSIGYQQLSIPIHQFKLNEINVIYLKIAKEQLQEITIKTKRKRKRKKRVRSRKLIKEAIKKIPVNYPSKNFTLVSYYRDYLKKAGAYYNLNEAIVQTIDSGFSKLHYTNNFTLLDYKKNKNFPRLTGLSSTYDTIWQAPDYQRPKKFIPYAKLPNNGGNELFILLAHDPIRNYKTGSFSFIHKLSVNFLKNHTFKSPIATYKGDLLLYKIKFYTRKEIRHNESRGNSENNTANTKSHYVIDETDSQNKDAVLVDGEIFINPKDHTIHKILYNGSLASTNKSIYALALEYNYTNAAKNSMALNYISFNNEFFAIDPKDKNYFKLVRYKKSGASILLTMNANVDAEFADNKMFFDITHTHSKKRIKIKKVVSGGNKIRVYLKNPEEINLDLNIVLNGIRDVNGRIINHKKIVQYYQYRELFVQEFNENLKYTKKCYLYNKPLSKNCISKAIDTEKYIMNSPLPIQDSLRN